MTHHLKIKNRTGAPLFFVFCTISSCTCAVCQEWLTSEWRPIAERRGATYGQLRIEPFDERVDRFCPRWNCMGACYFDAVPFTVNWTALYDYSQGKDYSIGNGKAELCFSHVAAGVHDSTAANRLKYLLLKNHGIEPLYFVYCTTSHCRCNVCQQWLQFETIPVIDCPGWTIGLVRVEPFTAKVERFCAQWGCMGCCFFGAQPLAVRKSMLFDYDEDTNYLIGGGKAALEFTHAVPEGSAWKSGLKLATTVGRVALAFGGVDVGALGDVAGFVSGLFGNGP